MNERTMEFLIHVAVWMATLWGLWKVISVIVTSSGIWWTLGLLVLVLWAILMWNTTATFLAGRSPVGKQRDTD